VWVTRELSQVYSWENPRVRQLADPTHLWARVCTDPSITFGMAGTCQRYSYRYDILFQYFPSVLFVILLIFCLFITYVSQCDTSTKQPNSDRDHHHHHLTSLSSPRLTASRCMRRHCCHITSAPHHVATSHHHDITTRCRLVYPTHLLLSNNIGCRSNDVAIACIIDVERKEKGKGRGEGREGTREKPGERQERGECNSVSQ
jgi:hypothetical protein